MQNKRVAFRALRIAPSVYLIPSDPSALSFACRKSDNRHWTGILEQTNKKKCSLTQQPNLVGPQSVSAISFQLPAPLLFRTTLGNVYRRNHIWSDILNWNHTQTQVIIRWQAIRRKVDTFPTTAPKEMRWIQRIPNGSFMRVTKNLETHGPFRENLVNLKNPDVDLPSCVSKIKINEKILGAVNISVEASLTSLTFGPQSIELLIQCKQLIQTPSEQSQDEWEWREKQFSFVFAGLFVFFSLALYNQPFCISSNCN